MSEPLSFTAYLSAFMFPLAVVPSCSRPWPMNSCAGDVAHPNSLCGVRGFLHCGWES
jgi:hypothetical protein